jgi:predicted TIM-barrel fold metal-dependent hydrolase
MRIDVHAHYWTDDYLDLLTDLGQADAGAARGLGAGGGTELAARLRLMDRAGVQMQVLSACPQTPYGEDGKKAAHAARFVNDQYAELAGRHRDRFAAFAGCPWRIRVQRSGAGEVLAGAAAELNRRRQPGGAGCG